MRLIAYEFQKIFQKKILIFVWFILITMLLLSFYWKCRENDIYDKNLYGQFYRQYAAMETHSAISELELQNGVLQILINDNIMRDSGMEDGLRNTIIEAQSASIGMTYDEVLEKYGAYADDYEALLSVFRVLEDLLEQYRYSVDYEAFLNEMPERAESLQTVSVFIKPDSFSYRNILKSVADYGRLDDVHVSVDYNKGILAFAKDKMPMLFLLVILLFFAAALYSEESDSGMMGLLASNKNGRLPLALAKWAALSLIAVLTVLTVSVGRIVCAGKILGFGDISRPLQSISYFRNCCYSLSVGDYLIISVLLWVFTILFASGLASLLFWIFKDVRIAGGIYGVYLFISYLEYFYIDDISAWNICKFINPFAFADSGGRFSSYQNLDIFGYPISVLCAGGVFFAVAMAIMLVGYLRAFATCFQLQLSFDMVRRKNRIAGSTKLHIHEMFRLYIDNYGIIALAFLLIWGYSGMEKGELLLSEKDYYYYSYSQQIEGEISEKTGQWILEEESRLSEARDKNNAVIGQYNNGELDESFYGRALYEMQQLNIRQEAFDKVVSQYRELKAVQDSGISVHFINAISTDAMFGNMTQYVYSGMLILLILVFSLSGMFSADYQTGMIYLVHTTRDGRKPLFESKYTAMFLFYTLGFACFAFPYWYNWLKFYRMYDWNAPLQSILQFIQVKGDISIIGFSVLWFVQMYISGCIFVIFQAALSDICRKNSITLIVSAICIVVDFLVSAFSIRLLQYVSISSGFALPMLLRETGDSRIIWIEIIKLIFAAAALLLWHRHRYIHEL